MQPISTAKKSSIAPADQSTSRTLNGDTENWSVTVLPARHWTRASDNLPTAEASSEGGVEPLQVPEISPKEGRLPPFRPAIWPIGQLNSTTSTAARTRDGGRTTPTQPLERPAFFVNNGELPLDSKPMCTLRIVGGYTNLPYRSTSSCPCK
jgi:hypothetical protein